MDRPVQHHLVDVYTKALPQPVDDLRGGDCRRAEKNLPHFRNYPNTPDCWENVFTGVWPFFGDVKAAVDSLEETKPELTVVIRADSDKAAVFTFDDSERFLLADGFFGHKDLDFLL